MKISFIVLTYSRSDALLAVLRSLAMKYLWLMTAPMPNRWIYSGESARISVVRFVMYGILIKDLQLL